MSCSKWTLRTYIETTHAKMALKICLEITYLTKTENFLLEKKKLAKLYSETHKYDQKI